MTDAFCSITRNVTFVTCFLLPYRFYVFKRLPSPLSTSAINRQPVDNQSANTCRFRISWEFGGNTRFFFACRWRGFGAWAENGQKCVSSSSPLQMNWSHTPMITFFSCLRRFLRFALFVYYEMLSYTHYTFVRLVVFSLTNID